MTIDPLDDARIRGVLTASDEEVGPACNRVAVPPTLDMSDDFREAYVQGYRHALNDVRRVLALGEEQTR